MRNTKWSVLFIFLAVLAGFMQPGPSNDETVYESLDTLAEVLTIAKTQSPEPVSAEKLVNSAIDGLLNQLDPHSNYYNANRYQTMKENQKGSYYGVGILVGYQNDLLTVVTPMAGGPAMKAGVKAGDVIAKIEDVDAKTLDMSSAIRLLRGEKGSQVNVVLERPNVSEPIPVVITREEIPSENVRASFMLEDKTGYVALKDFGETATYELSSAILKLQAQGMNQLILDLRGNPGGLLPQAIGVASLFIPGEKLVVSTQGRIHSANQKYHSKKRSPVDLMPLIVLIDRGSASASEIVAGAIQDHDRGLILGVNSWGKGLVQSVFPLSDGEKGLALTTARYYTPAGRNIQGSYDSLDEYYEPPSSESLYFDEHPANLIKTFKTIHGRDVLETRGIVPDVYIGFPKVPAFVQNLDGRYNAFFNFATQFQDESGPVHRDWRGTEALLPRFKQFLMDEGVVLEAFEANHDLIVEKLTYQILHIHEPKWAWQYLIEQDNQVQAAMALFDQASELNRVYAGNAKLPDNYSAGLKQFAKLNQPDQETP